MDEIELLYEDNHLLVVVKPYGVPSQADCTGDPDMLTRMKAYIKAWYHKPGEVYLGLVHRLDRPVGGIMAFARTSKAAARLSAQLRSGAFKKTYLAVVKGETPQNGELTDYLFKVEEENRVYVADENTPGAKIARLSYKSLAYREGLSLLSVELHTGRPHQIRVQLANQGFPIWGDGRYGDGKSGQRIALFAARLRFLHPTKQTRLEFAKSPPEISPWDMFAEIEAFVNARDGVRIVYEDDHIVIAEKQPGLETQGEISCESAASEITGHKLAACHRLDAMTGGLLLLAKHDAAREAAEEAMRRRQIVKTYRCIVKGIPEPRKAVLEAYLTKDADNARVTVSESETPGGRRIVTQYETLSETGGNALLSVTLHTGRTHQIRAHMAFIGHPVLGDDKYGDRALNKALKIKTQALWATNLAFSIESGSLLRYLNGMEFESEAGFD